MRKDLLIVALGLFATAGVAGADVVSVSETGAEAKPAITLPAKGTSMASVKKQFGEPRDKRAPVGGDSPKHPPITRWDYAGFVVIFENDRVIDAVVPGAPPKLHNTAGLTPATSAPPPPSMPPPDQPPPDQPPPPDMPPPDQSPPPDASPIIPEAPAEAAAPPMESTAEAAAAGGMPSMSEPPPPAAESPTPEPAAPAPAAEPAPAPPAEPQNEDGPPTPK